MNQAQLIKINLVSAVQAEVEGLLAIYLFGSRAGDNEQMIHPESDWDVAILKESQGPIGGIDKFRLSARVAEKVGVAYIDLVDLSQPGLHELKLNIIDGERLWALDIDQTDAWEAQTITKANDWLLGERWLREAKIDELSTYGQSDYSEKS